mmetsp:Transcript_33906/g.93776  ORF Transcript_33906/g.93776 Transcript_33906/m.93776 type:complete len:213 (+) Transcript_33906:131-769(+)
MPDTGNGEEAMRTARKVSPNLRRPRPTATALVTALATAQATAQATASSSRPRRATAGSARTGSATEALGRQRTTASRCRLLYGALGRRRSPRSGRCAVPALCWSTQQAGERRLRLSLRSSANGWPHQQHRRCFPRSLPLQYQVQWPAPSGSSATSPLLQPLPAWWRCARQGVRKVPRHIYEPVLLRRSMPSWTGIHTMAVFKTSASSVLAFS